MGSSISHVAPLQYRGDCAERKRNIPPATDLNKWHLEVCEGRQIWHYVEDELTEEQKLKYETTARDYHVNPIEAGVKNMDKLNLVEIKTYEDVLRNGVEFFGSVQTKDGHWAGDYGGPMFLLPGYAITMYITKQPIPEPNRKEMLRYLFNMQNEDGGWGIHIESISTMLGTVLNYVCVRLLGVGVDDERVKKTKQWIQEHSDGVAGLSIPQWGKFYLALLNITSWDLVNSLFPEIILFPEIFPLHTQRMWSYARTVYMPMTYLAGIRFQAPVDDLILELRNEILPQPFEKIEWYQYRNTVAKEDLYTPHTRILDIVFNIFNAYEYIAPSFIRKWALDKTYEIGVAKESEFTKYICIGPVNKVLNTLCTWIVEGPESVQFQKHLNRLPDYFWMGRDGMKMNGTNGSQLWDTAFMVQGLIENAVVRDEFSHVFLKANEFLDVSQIQINHPDHNANWRDQTKGGWPFSTRDMGWVVADTTGEGLRASLIVKKYNYSPTPLSDERLFDGVNILLLMQNSTGGYATCEKTRGSRLFEWFNASEVFGEIMIDYDYVECTSSALQAMVTFHEDYPNHRPAEIVRAIKKARDFILTQQLEDGSFEGMWGICFTYGTWFAVDGLKAAGLDYSNSKEIEKACEFLITKQNKDGGWGESFLSCVKREYVHHSESQIVNTAWAILTLLGGEYPCINPIRRGCKFLRDKQMVNGDWPQESICGVFNKNCMISYSNFKNVFPIWALARFSEKYPNEPAC